MEATIQSFEGHGLARYVGAVTFRASNATEAAFLHLLVKIDDWAKVDPEWYAELCCKLAEPIHWPEEKCDDRIRTGERKPETPASKSPDGWKPHPTNYSAFERVTKPIAPKPQDSKRPGLSLEENKPKVKVLLKSTKPVQAPSKSPANATPQKNKVVLRVAKKK